MSVCSAYAWTSWRLVDHYLHPPFGNAVRDWSSLGEVHHQTLMTQNCKMTWGTCNSLQIRIYASIPQIAILRVDTQMASI